MQLFFCFVAVKIRASVGICTKVKKSGRNVPCLRKKYFKISIFVYLWTQWGIGGKNVVFGRYVLGRAALSWQSGLCESRICSCLFVSFVVTVNGLVYPTRQRGLDADKCACWNCSKSGVTMVRSPLAVLLIATTLTHSQAELYKVRICLEWCPLNLNQCVESSPLNCSEKKLFSICARFEISHWTAQDFYFVSDQEG